MEIALSVKNVVKKYGDFTAVNDVSFDVEDGKFFSILGPSGCGKTTLLRMIAGFFEPTAGSIQIRGKDMANVPPNKRPVNLVFQHLALFPMMDVKENIAFGLRRRGETQKILEKIGCSFKHYIDKYSSVNQFNKVKLFMNLTPTKIEEIFEKVKIKKIPNGQNAITQGEPGTEFFIVKKGTFDMFINDKYIRSLNENEYFGERALFFNEKRSATAKAKGDCEVYYLEKTDFENVIKDELKDYLLNRLYLQDDSIELDDLIFQKNLGIGSYGIVSLVKNKKNDYLYAIKNISAKQILSCKLMNNIELEKSILLKVDHPFIVKLVKTLKDKKYIYYLMEYIKGKELFYVIRDIGILNKAQARFYIGSIILAVQYLHERKFLFRDIKPENIMVLENGYIKLIDFGTATELKDKTKSIIGTPQYMAPEVILGDLYSFEVDFWSIGICLYEFCCGVLPFGENEEDPTNIYMSVINE